MAQFLVSCTNTIAAEFYIISMHAWGSILLLPSFKACMYESQDTKFKKSHFPIRTFHMKGQGLPLHIENAWEKHDII